MIKDLAKKLIMTSLAVGLSLTAISCCDLNCRFEKVIRESRREARKAENAYLNDLDKQAKEGYMETINKRIYQQDRKIRCIN